MTVHDDMSPETMAARHEVREERYEEREDRRDIESNLRVKMSTVLTTFVGLLAIIAATSNIWVYTAVQKIDMNSNRLSVLETSQASQARMLEKFFADNSIDTKEMKARLQIYGENQAVFMAKQGLTAKKYHGLVDW